MANYNEPDDAGVAYTRQRDLIIDAIKTYGTANIGGVTVGNEFMLKCVTPISYTHNELILGSFSYLTANGASDPNSAIGNQGAALLIANITDTRNALKALNLPTTVQVGNSDAGSYFNNLVLEVVDYGVGVGCLLSWLQ